MGVVSVVHEKTFASPLRSPYLVMEYAEYGSLDAHGVLTLAEVEQAFYKIFDALQYLHDQGIVHRDLKPGNVLVVDLDPIVVKLADFGVSSNRAPLRTFAGTVEYGASEVWNRAPSESSYTDNCDVWSLGVMLLERALVAGLSFPNVDGLHEMDRAGFSQRVIQFIKYQKEHGTVRIGYQRLAELIRQMLTNNPAARPSADDCCMQLAESWHECHLIMYEPSTSRTLVNMSALLLHFGEAGLMTTYLERYEVTRRQGERYLDLAVLQGMATTAEVEALDALSNEADRGRGLHSASWTFNEWNSRKAYDGSLK